MRKRLRQCVWGKYAYEHARSEVERRTGMAIQLQIVMTEDKLYENRAVIKKGRKVAVF